MLRSNGTIRTRLLTHNHCKTSKNNTTTVLLLKQQPQQQQQQQNILTSYFVYIYSTLTQAHTHTHLLAIATFTTNARERVSERIQMLQRFIINLNHLEHFYTYSPVNLASYMHLYT